MTAWRYGLAMPLQARAPRSQPLGEEAFETGDGTVLRWLGMGGFSVNSRGTTLMIDPLLGGFDMPVMIESTARSRWPTPTPTRRCCCTTGAAWTPPTSRRSMPTPTL
jgi:hypothetical protein